MKLSAVWDGCRSLCIVLLLRMSDRDRLPDLRPRTCARRRRTMCRTGHIAILDSRIDRAWRNRQLDEFEWCWRYLLDPGVRLRTESSSCWLARTEVLSRNRASGLARSLGLAVASHSYLLRVVIISLFDIHLLIYFSSRARARHLPRPPLLVSVGLERAPRILVKIKSN